MKDFTYEVVQGSERNAFGWNDECLAFVKCDRVSNSDVWRLFSSDGTELAVTDSRDLAFILARQHDFAPQSVH